MMQATWLNDGEPDENGDYIAEIQNAVGNRVSTFKGKTYKEVADRLLESQIQANLTITKQRRPDSGRSALRVEQRQLTPTDRMRLAQDINTPERVVEAVEEIVAARTGIAPEKLGSTLSRMSQSEQDAFYAAEAQSFRDDHPDFYPVPQNRDAMFDELKANGWDLTRNNLAIVYQTLLDREELIPWPENETREDEPAPRTNGNRGQTTAPSAPSPRPRTIATGIRNSDASASAPAPMQRKAKYTRADIERMPRAEYNDKLRSDPEFRRQVDAMGA